MAFKPSKELVDFIKKKEGLRTKPYKDFDGRLAVGYGDTSNVTGPISEIEAETRLQKRLEEGASRLANTIKRSDLTQGQIDAMLDLEYNMGFSKMSDIINLVNSGKDSEVLSELGKYTKARNEKGEMVELKGLVERSKARQKMWGGGIIEAPSKEVPTDIFSNASSIDIDAAIDSIDVPSAPSFNLDEAIDSISIEPKDPVDKVLSEFNFAADINEDPSYVSQKEKAKEFSRQEGIPFDEAEALIFQRDPNIVKVKRESESIVKLFPELAQWASDPVNFKKVAQNPKQFSKVTAAAKNLNPSVLNDFKRVAKENIWAPIEAVYASAAIMGRISPEEAEKVLNEIEMERRATPYSKYAGDIEKVSQAFSRIKWAIQGPGGAALSTLGDIFQGEIGAIQGIKKAYAQGSVTVDQVYESLKKVAENWEAFALMGAQSTSSFALPLAGRAAGAVVGAPIGLSAPAQAAGAYMGSFVLGFGSKLKEELEAFRNPETGMIDMKKALSDPKRVSRWKAEAANYSAAMSIVDTLFTMKMGSFTGKAGTATTKVGKVTEKAVSVAKEGVTQAAGEGLSESVGQVQAASVAQFYGDPFTKDKALDIVANGLEEAAFSIIPGAVTGTASGVSQKAVTYSKERLIKKLKQVEVAKEVNALYSASQDLRKAIEETPELKSPEDVKDFIKATTEVAPKEVSSLSDDVDVQAEEDAIFSSLLDTKAPVNVTAADFDAYMESVGVDPLSVIQNMPQTTIDEYNTAKRQGGSFDVDYASWASATKDFKNIDAIARFNGSKMTPLQAKGIEIQFNEDPFRDIDGVTAYHGSPYDEQGSEPPPVPGEDVPDVIPGERTDVVPALGGPDVQIVEGDEDSDLVMRQVELTSRFKDPEEKKAFKKFISAFKKAVDKSPDIKPEAVETLGEIEWEHMKFRARLLGKTPAELIARLKLGKRTSRPSASGTFFPGGFGLPYTIGFSEAATVKTMIHELGHSWLHELSEDFVILSEIPEDQRTEEQKEMLRLMDVIVKEVNSRGIKMNNISELYSLRREDLSAVHEMFSQTTEVWALEGKHQNSRLKYILEHFRSWLAKIAELIGKTYPQWPAMKLTPEVERLFQFITNGDQKVKEELMPMFSQPEYPAGFFGKDHDKYMEAWYDARSEAVGDFISKAVRRSYAEREVAIKNALNDIRDRASQEIDQLPSMQILKNFQNAYQLYKNKQIEFNPRINDKSLKELFDKSGMAAVYTWEGFKEIIPRDFYAGDKKGGVDVNDVMLQMGINSGDEFIQLMMQAGQREELIENRMNEIIEKEFPVFKSDEEIHKAAVEAINGRGREKLVNETFNILKNKYPKEFRRLIEKGMLPNSAFGDKEMKSFLKDQAVKEIMSKSVAGLKPLKLMDESDRLGKEAASMFRRGDIEEAMELKYKQVQLFYQSKAALDLLRQVAHVEAVKKKAQKLFANQQKHSEYDVDILQFANDLIIQSGKDYNLPKLDVNKISTFSGVNPTNVDDINTMIDHVRELGRYNPGDRSTVEVHLAFGNLIEVVLGVAKNAKSVEVGGKLLQLQAAVEQTVNEVGTPKSTDPKVTREQLESYNVQSVWHLKNLSTVSLDRMLSSLMPSDADYVKSLLGYLMTSVKEAEAKRTQVINDIRENLNKAAKAAFKDDSFSFSKDGILAAIGLSSESSKPIQSPELNVTFRNKAQLISFLLQTGSEDGLKKAMLGGVNNSGPIGGFDPITGKIDTTNLDAMIERLIQEKKLTKQDFEFMQVVWQSFERMYPDLKKSQREIRGINVGYIEGREIKTSLGVFKGGYVPITASAPFLDRVKRDLFLDPGQGDMMAALIPAISKESTISRTNAVYDVDLDLGRILTKLNGVANLAYIYPAMVNIGKVFAQQEVQAALEARRPGIMEKVVYPWFKRTSLQQYTEPTDQTNLIYRFSKEIRQNIPMVFYLFNPGSILKQPIGIVQAVPVVGLSNIAVSSLQFMANPASAVRIMREQSSRMKARHQKGQTQLVQDYDRLNLNFSTVNSLKEWGRSASFFGIQWTQNYTDAVVWHAAYRKGLNEGMRGKQAVTYADNAVEKTQGSTGVSGLTNIQAGNDLTKLFTQLLTVPLALRGVSYEGGARAETVNNKIKFYLGFTMFSIVLASSLEQLVNMGIKSVSKAISGEEDEDEKLRKKGYSESAIADKNATDFTLRLLGQGAETVFPVFGRQATSIALYNRINPSPAGSLLAKDLAIASSGVKDFTNGINMTSEQVEAMIRLFTVISGIPLTPAEIGIKLNEGSKTDSEKMIEDYERRLQKQMKRFEDMR
jgi:GH24 family phage-related lysozyme (muramidase)